MTMRLVPTRPEAVNSILVLGGVVIVVVQVLAIADSRLQMAVVAGGIMMIYLGVLRLRKEVLRENRAYLKLRSEVDHFLRLVREINTQAISGESALVDDTKAAMQESVDRIASVAGVADKES